MIVTLVTSALVASLAPMLLLLFLGFPAEEVVVKVVRHLSDI